MLPCFARGLVAWLLPPAILLQACASAVPPVPVTALDPANLAVVHRALEDQPVTLVLASGEVVREAEEVVVGPESTSWREDDRRREVPTSQVCKVIRQLRFRAGKGYAWGTLACAPIALGISSAQSDPFAGLGYLILIEGLCPLIGIFIARGSSERVVYEAPGRCGAGG